MCPAVQWRKDHLQMTCGKQPANAATMPCVKSTPWEQVSALLERSMAM